MKHKRTISLLWMLALMLSLFALAGCGAESGTQEKKTAEKIELAYPKGMQEQGFKEPIALDKMPERVISLTNTPVLTLHALGIKQIAVPDTKIMEWPEDMKDVQRIQTGMKSNIDIESVVSMQPDLVFVGMHAKDTYGKLLEQEKIPVYYVASGPGVSYESVKDMTLCLVDALGKGNEKAEEIRKSFEDIEKRTAEEKTKNQGKKIMIVQGMAPNFYLQNQSGTVGSMFQLLGFDNVASASAGSMVPLNQEEALSYQPDIMVFVEAMNGAEEHQAMMEKEFAQNAAYWNQFTAIKKKQILYLPRWFAVSGGLEELQQMDYLIRARNSLEAAAHE